MLIYIFNYYNKIIESTRTPIGESGVVNHIARVHKGYNKACFGNEAVFKLSSSTYIQILRAYANICFDNG